MMYRKDTGEILGVHIIGLHAADLIHEASNAIATKQTVQVRLRVWLGDSGLHVCPLQAALRAVHTRAPLSPHAPLPHTRARSATRRTHTHRTSSSTCTRTPR
jgi:hypothetical protein